MRNKHLLFLFLISFLFTGCSCQGIDGPEGPQGPQGIQGEKGDTGVSITKVEKSSSEGNVDTYVINFSNGTTSSFNITNGVNGETPTISIGANGNWYINDVDTEISAKGIQGEKGDTGKSIISVLKTSTLNNVDTYTIIYSDLSESTFTITNGKDGKDGASILTGNKEPISTLGNDGDSYIDLETFDYYLKESGNWIKKGNIKGSQGEVGPQGNKGNDGVSITKVEKTSSKDNVDTYTIYFSDETSSNFNITNGIDGVAPSISIGANGNWFINNVDTQKSAKGPQGEKGDKGETGVSITTVIKTSSLNNIDTYTINYSNGETSTFTVTNGKDGASLLNGSGIPTVSLGEDGDSYINLDLWDYYIKESGSWIKKGNIRGEQGEAGVSVINTVIDENGDLIVTLSNNETINAGHVKDVVKYTVNFYCNEELLATKEVLANSKLEELAEEETKEYLIDYWYVEGYPDKEWEFSGYYADRVTEDVNLFAALVNPEYIYDFEKGEGECSVKSMVIKPNKPYTLPVPTISKTRLDWEYTFDCWLLDGERIPQEGNSWDYSSLDRTLTAQYKLRDDDEYLETKYQFTLKDDVYSLKMKENSEYQFGYIPSQYKGKAVTSIENNAFKDNQTLTFVKFSNDVMTIGSNAFDGCSSLKTVTMYSGVTTIGEKAFSNCASLPFIYIPNTVIEIGANAFASCPSLEIYCEGPSSMTDNWDTNWNYDNNTVRWEFKSQVNFYYEILGSGDSRTIKVKQITHFGFDYLFVPSFLRIDGEDIPITEIGDRAFNFCKFKSVTIANGIKSIGSQAFKGCDCLTSILIPSSVTSIGSSVFEACDSLSSVTLPDSLVSIGENAFFQCGSLSSIFIPKSVTFIDRYAFDKCLDIVLYCEASSVHSGWQYRWNEGVKEVLWNQTRS